MDSQQNLLNNNRNAPKPITHVSLIVQEDNQIINNPPAKQLVAPASRRLLPSSLAIDTKIRKREIAEPQSLKPKRQFAREDPRKFSRHNDSQQGYLANREPLTPDSGGPLIKMMPDQSVKIRTGQRLPTWKAKKINKNLQSFGLQLTQILSFYLGQNKNLTNRKKEGEPFEPYEVEQIRRQSSELGLGLFVIKVPNPDNPPEDFLQMHDLRDKKKMKQKARQASLDSSMANEEVEKNDIQVPVSYGSAVGMYAQLFDTEDAQSIRIDEIQKTAFQLAFFLLNLTETKLQELSLKDKSKAATVERFLSCFYFYKSILKVEKPIQYEKLKKDTPELAKAEAILPQQFQSDLKKLLQADESTSEEKKNPQKMQNLPTFENFRERLKAYMIDELDVDSGIKDEQSILFLVLKCCNSISYILEVFYSELLLPLLIFVKDREKQQFEEKQLERLFCGGAGLAKVPIDEKGTVFQWVQQKGRPQDLLSLLRNVIVYKLTRRANLYVRKFLSKDENYIYLVVNSCEAVLERYAQKNQMLKEVEMGTVDLFAFEPIDFYYRPLRIHNFVRDKFFKAKYNLDNQDDQEDPQEQKRSYETRVIYDYKKIVKMNPDQLRSKLIKQVEQLDKACNWISDKLNIDFIEPQMTLANNDNSEQVSEAEWQIYYIYVRLVLQYHRRVKQCYEKLKKDKLALEDINNNLGLVYRLVFEKALWYANEIYDKHGKTGLFSRALRWFTGGSYKLRNLWEILETEEPTAYREYVQKKKLQRLWRKYEVNEMRDRSKFSLSERVYITSKLINKVLNISPGIVTKAINSYFPLHDAYVLKGIKIRPYLKVFSDKKILTESEIAMPQKSHLNDLLKQLENPNSAQDFTNESIEQKLQFRWSRPRQYTNISIETIMSYAGAKIAIMFNFLRFTAEKAVSMMLISFIVQILLWVQNSQLTSTQTSNMTQFNNILLYIFMVLNIIWMTNYIEKWRKEQKRFSNKFGLENIDEEEEKRALFRGRYKRNYKDDNMNFSYVPVWIRILKLGYSNFISVLYICLVVTINLLIYTFREYLFQKNFSASTVNTIPSILIAVATQILNLIYGRLSVWLTDFQNHKTISQYESSLILKQFLITLVNNYNAIFLISFCSSIFPTIHMCRVKTSLGPTIENCQLQVSNQMLTSALVLILMRIVSGFTPYIKFLLREYLASRKSSNKSVIFNGNFYESIDKFFQEQDSMDSYMLNQETDNTSKTIMTTVQQICSQAMFAVGLPVSYCIMYFDGILNIHSTKFEVLYLSQRTIPHRVKDLGIWQSIINIMSFLGVIVNVCFVIFTRQIQSSVSLAKIAFISVLILIVIKAIMSILYTDSKQQDMILEQRSTYKIEQALVGSSKIRKQIQKNREPNSDIRNVKYDQQVLKRKLPDLDRAHVTA